MSKCPNCGAKLSCGCQRRVASNGAACCSSCVTGYNAKLAGKAPAPVKQPIPERVFPGITPATPGTEPSNVSIQVNRRKL